MYPPIENGALKTWVGVGGSPESVVRAARYGLPLTLAIIGGNPQRFRLFVDLYIHSLRNLLCRCCRLQCTRRGTSPRPTSKRKKSCGRTTK